MVSKAEKIIIRNKITQPSKIFSKFTMLTAEKNFESVKTFLDFYGIKFVMNEVFEEELVNENLETSTLYQKYLECEQTGEDNDYFKFAYKLKPQIAVKITQHITAHKIVRVHVNEENIVPWYYVDSKMFVADTWWEEDKDVIRDLNTLSFIDFLDKYKVLSLRKH